MRPPTLVDDVGSSLELDAAEVGAGGWYVDGDSMRPSTLVDDVGSSLELDAAEAGAGSWCVSEDSKKPPTTSSGSSAP